MCVERIKLFFAKHKTIKALCLIILAIIALYFAIIIPYKSYADILDTSRGIVGTLLGAFVGGGFTLIGSITVTKHTQKATNAIKKKNIIFKPLYDELMENHSIYLKENPYPRYISFEK